MLEKIIRIKTAAHKAYQVYIGNDISAGKLTDLTFGYDAVFYLVDDCIYRQYPDLFLKLKVKSNRLYLIRGGEAAKSMRSAEAAMLFLTQQGISRRSLIVAIGGGAVCDLAGFVAATILRAVSLIMVPTTLLAQVDASIGGKNGVNLATGKNLVGTVYPPLACIHDYQFLTSLKRRDIISGFAEILKHALIKDAKLFDKLLAGPKPLDLFKNITRSLALIYRSCLIKARVVEKDEHEANLRAILNFGHSIGHFIEQASGYKKFRHGECVLAGMGFSCFLSTKLSGLSAAEYNQIVRYISSFFKPLLLNKKVLESFEAVINRDKKKAGAQLKFVALNKIGSAVFIPLDSSLLKVNFIEYTQRKDSLIKLQ